MFFNLLEPPINLFEAPINLFEAPINLFKPLIHLMGKLIEALVDLIDAFIDLIDALVDLLDTLVDLIHAFIHLMNEFLDEIALAIDGFFKADEASHVLEELGGYVRLGSVEPFGKMILHVGADCLQLSIAQCFGAHFGNLLIRYSYDNRLVPLLSMGNAGDLRRGVFRGGGPV